MLHISQTRGDGRCKMSMLDIVFIIISVIFTLLATLYIYERGYRAGFAEGENHDPYKIVTQGWRITLPGKGTILMLRNIQRESEGGNGSE